MNDITNDIRHINFITKLQYQNQNDSGRAIIDINAGINIPASPIKIILVVFKLDTSQVTYGKGSKLKSITFAPTKIAAIECPASCKNGYKIIATNKPAKNRPTYLKTSFIHTPHW